MKLSHGSIGEGLRQGLGARRLEFDLHVAVDTEIVTVSHVTCDMSRATVVAVAPLTLNWAPDHDDQIT